MSAVKINVSENARKKSPRRLRPTIRKEAVNPAAYNHFKLPWSCDECCHFEREKGNCSLGYNTEFHRRKQQESDYELGGQFALCRFQEID
jgi:hypothetical protein